jgi:hypothetical protein
MRRYFYLEHAEDETFGVGYALYGADFSLLAEGQYYDNWRVVTFALKNGEYPDYLANDLGWSLCSRKLKDILNGSASSVDSIQWLDARVVHPSGESRRYYILHLPMRPDVLDGEKTIYAAKGFVVKPCLRPDAIGNHAVFSYPGATVRVIVAEHVRDAIVSADCTGIDFSLVPLSRKDFG